MGRPRELSPEERDLLIRRGYRPVEVWVPDPTNPSYLADARRQAANSVEADEKAGIDELYDPTAYEDWDRP
ncbi:antitoxin MazE-like protein [Rhizobium sp. 9140]|uniref:antitoxin MazE-like protein n=1 Tax=Rhizobium sp. 9140 TaxID=1761900 RepID=UPI0007922B71|nr:antitoxin MazE-like protein [Rhizobium sp. 9140]CZT35925.1 Protein of unknown function (DUF3018) [Rhizobium sp. 9140]